MGNNIAHGINYEKIIESTATMASVMLLAVGILIESVKLLEKT